MRITTKIFVTLAITTVLIMPLFSYAVDFSKTIVPCGWDGAHKPLGSGGAPVTDGKITEDEMCTFNDFVRMAGLILNGTVIFISVYAAISFMYAGYAYLTSGGSQEKVSYAKGIFFKVLTGYIIVLTAWLIVYMLEQTFYTEDPNARPDSFLQGGEPT